MSNPTDITIRTLEGSDSAQIHRLAQLDSAGAPELPLLGAEQSGRIVAAVSLADADVGPIADPFLPTAGTLELLSIRAEQIRSTDCAGGRVRGLLGRLRHKPPRSRAALAGSPPGGGGRLLEL